MVLIRILWVSHRDIKHHNAGGAEKAIYEISKRLANMGHVVIWHSVMDNGTPVSEMISGITVKRSSTNVLAHISLPIVIKKERPDVVIDDLGHAVPWGSEFLGVKGTASFWHLHRRSLPGQVSLPTRFILSGLEALYPFIYRKFTFVTESESSKNDLKKLGINDKRIKVIHLGLNSDDFIKVGKSQNPKLVYFGGLRDYKRPWESVYAMKEIVKKYPDSKLYVIGSGPSLERVRKTIIQEGLSNSVVLTGRLAEPELKQLVGSSWVNIHSSLTEGFGLSIIEASALGTPTVAYSVPGVSEAVADGKNGILVPDGDLNELTEAVTGIIDSFPGNWRSSSIEVAKEFSWDSTAKMWEEHLKKTYQSNQ